MTVIEDTQNAQALGRKPTDDQVDFYGVTHQGKVRDENQDHFLLSSLHKRMDVHLTSLPDPDKLYEEPDRLAYLAMVADGVGGGPSGEAASRLALEAVSQYVTGSMDCYYTADPTDDQAFTQALADAALHGHEDVRQGSDAAPGHGMATTLTLMLFVWPRAYLLQVGDSRYYILRDGDLTQISRDQTLAQVLVDDDVFSRTEARKSPLSNVLSSAIGGSETTPVVTGIDNTWDYVHLICSDGLTKHVSDELIAERLRSMTSSQQACEALLQDALDDGGSDNITIIVGRSVKNEA
jgi:protein phosphatase